MRIVASAEPLPQPYGTVLVSGAAGAIGQATCRKLLNGDWTVIGVDWNPAVEDLHRRRTDFVPVHADLSSAKGFSAALEAAQSHGTLRHVVALSSGVPADKSRHVSDELARSVEEDLTMTFAFVQALVPLLRAEETADQEAGASDRSITICSPSYMLAEFGLPGHPAADAGLISMVHQLALELGPSGIRANGIAFDRLPTPHAGALHAASPGLVERTTSSSCLGRAATAQDCADAIAALALDLRAVTGHVLTMDAVS